MISKSIQILRKNECISSTIFKYLNFNVIRKIIAGHFMHRGININV